MLWDRLAAIKPVRPDSVEIITRHSAERRRAAWCSTAHAHPDKSRQPRSSYSFPSVANFLIASRQLCHARVNTRAPRSKRALLPSPPLPSSIPSPPLADNVSFYKTSTRKLAAPRLFSRIEVGCLQRLPGGGTLDFYPCRDTDQRRSNEFFSFADIFFLPVEPLWKFFFAIWHVWIGMKLRGVERRI